MNLFAEFAPSYWEKGLPAIPLVPNAKRPIPLNWQRYADEMPTEEQARSWVGQRPDANIGLALGPQSRMLALDIDTDDPVVMKCLQELLPESPWVRVGKKGAVWAYRYDGQKTFRIKTAENKTLVEMLSKGTQIVVPPSIHPETMKPYEANCFLPEVIDALPSLPQDVEAIMRTALESAGINLSHSGWTRVSDFVPVGARDNAMVSHAGILARAVTRGERTLLECFGEMNHWIKNFTQQVDGDPLDPVKGQQRIVQFLLRDVLGDRCLALPEGWDAGLSDEDKKKLGLTLSDEHLQWTYDRLKKYLCDEFEAHERGSHGRETAVRYALNALARSKNIASLDEERIVKFITDSAGLDMPAPAIRKHIKELKAGQVAGTNHAELAKAVLKDTSCFGDIKYAATDFWQWKGADWQKVGQDTFLRHIAEDYGSMPAAKRSADHQGIVKVMSSLAAGALRQTETAGINFANGYLTKELKLLPHHPSFGMTYTLPYRYLEREKAGTMTRFDHFLYTVWGQDEDFPEKVNALRQAICITLFGMGPLYNRAITLFGMPNSGKTQLLNIVRGLMPEDSVSQVGPSDWNDRFLPMQMHGKLLNICGELSENQFIDGAKFKMIVEGEAINGQFKGRDIVPFFPVCTHWFAGNHLPRTRDTSAGFSRRWLFLEFNKPVAAADKVLGIANVIIAEEREAIVAWAVGAMKDLRNLTDLSLPRSHNKVLNDMANQNNSVRYFLTTSGGNKFQLGKNGRSVTLIPEAKLYDAYCTFCINQWSGRPVSMKAFKFMMKELQAEFGFAILIQPDGSAVYENLTLVK